jgi:HTH-type transcriptional repressor of NAD biosynthesis genes
MTAWTLMTAMPPTRGHENLMQFVSWVEPFARSRVIIATQPGEPMVAERVNALRNAAFRTNGVDVFHLHQELPQDPSTPGFWAMWKQIMEGFGFRRGDTFVSSEPYGAKLADVLGGKFMVFDPGRELHPAKATLIREDRAPFDHIMPEFQPYLRSTVTVWGAESTGKTTLSKALAQIMDGHWVYEWARPYLESYVYGYGPRQSRLGDLGTDINVDSMTDIWHGQYAAQRLAQTWRGKPFIVQDTDLYSTIGYWEQPHWTKELGRVPEELIQDAKGTQSDLYLITTATIPFEQDPLRYGGTKQESPDEFWIGIAEKYGLNYKVLDFSESLLRESWGMKYMNELRDSKDAQIAYERIDYDKVVPEPSPVTQRIAAANPGRLVSTL